MLAKAGYDAEASIVLAMRGDPARDDYVDLHEAVDLASKTGVELATEILM